MSSDWLKSFLKAVNDSFSCNSRSIFTEIVLITWPQIYYQLTEDITLTFKLPSTKCSEFHLDCAGRQKVSFDLRMPNSSPKMQIVVLLGGGDKPSQSADIEKALEIARSSGITREALYKALRPDARPRFDTVARVCKALGVKLEVRPATST